MKIKHLLHSEAENVWLTTLTSLDYTKEVEELILWFQIIDWWEENRYLRGLPKPNSYEKDLPPVYTLCSNRINIILTRLQKTLLGRLNGQSKGSRG